MNIKGPQGEPGINGANGSSAFMPVSQTAETTTTVTANSCVVITGQPTALSITLGTPATDMDTEWRLIFKAGENFQLSDTAPSGYTLQWEAEPVWQSGTIYEISYANMFLTGSDDNIIIGVLWRAWT